MTRGPARVNRRWAVVAFHVVFLALGFLGWGCDVPGSGSRTARASAAPGRPLPSLRFGRRTAGCGDAFVFTTNDGLTEVLGVGASREALRLTPSPKSFRIEGRPPGLNVWVDVYPKKPEILAECTDLFQQPPLR